MSAMLSAGTCLHRRYEIISALGQGSFGTVYQARDRRARAKVMRALSRKPDERFPTAKKMQRALEGPDA